MESISSTAFDISEALGLGLTLSDFDPEGDFESKKIILEHNEDKQITFIYPDTITGTDTHTTLCNGFGVLSFST